MNNKFRNMLVSNTEILLAELRSDEQKGLPVDFKAVRILVLRLYELAFLPESERGKETLADYFENCEEFLNAQKGVWKGKNDEQRTD